MVCIITKLSFGKNNKGRGKPPNSTHTLKNRIVYINISTPSIVSSKNYTFFFSPTMQTFG